MNWKCYTNPNAMFKLDGNITIKIGKRRFYKLFFPEPIKIKQIELVRYLLTNDFEVNKII